MPEDSPSTEQPEQQPSSSSSSPAAGTVGKERQGQPQAIPSDQVATPGSVNDDVERMMMEELTRAGSTDPLAAGSGVAERTSMQRTPLPTVQPAEFGRLDRTGSTGSQKNIEILLDVKLPISIELGRTEMAIRDILELTNGSVVELDKLAGEPVDLLVNNKVVAKGEVVVVDENFGIRVTSLLSPEERIKSL